MILKAGGQKSYHLVRSARNTGPPVFFERRLSVEFDNLQELVQVVVAIVDAECHVFESVILSLEEAESATSQLREHLVQLFFDVFRQESEDSRGKLRRSPLKSVL